MTPDESRVLAQNTAAVNRLAGLIEGWKPAIEGRVETLETDFREHKHVCHEQVIRPMLDDISQLQAIAAADAVEDAHEQGIANGVAERDERRRSLWSDRRAVITLMLGVLGGCIVVANFVLVLLA